MPTNHRGTPIGNPATSHGGHTAQPKKADWSSLTAHERGWATLYPTSTPAETIKKDYSDRGLERTE